MDASVSMRSETTSDSMEALVARRAREIAEQEVHKLMHDLLTRIQSIFTVPVVAPSASEYLTIAQAARKYHLNENTIRRVVLIGKLSSTHKSVPSPRGTRQVLMVSATDLDAWHRSR